jgi:predicted small lipoprotein YifL
MRNTHPKHGNKIANRLYTKPVTSLILLMALTACGQRGALYIPTAPEAAQRSSIVETLTSPDGTDKNNNTSSTRTPMTAPSSK